MLVVASAMLSYHTWYYNADIRVVLCAVYESVPADQVHHWARLKLPRPFPKINFEIVGFALESLLSFNRYAPKTRDKSAPSSLLYILLTLYTITDKIAATSVYLLVLLDRHRIKSQWLRYLPIIMIFPINQTAVAMPVGNRREESPLSQWAWVFSRIWRRRSLRGVRWRRWIHCNTFDSMTKF